MVHSKIARWVCAAWLNKKSSFLFSRSPIYYFVVRPFWSYATNCNFITIAPGLSIMVLAMISSAMQLHRRKPIVFIFGSLSSGANPAIHIKGIEQLYRPGAVTSPGVCTLNVKRIDNYSNLIYPFLISLSCSRCGAAVSRVYMNE